MRKMKSIAAAALVMLCVSLMPAGAKAAEQDTKDWNSYEVIQSGDCGKTKDDDVKYTMYRESEKSVIIRISGTGAMKDFLYKDSTGSYDYPWILPEDDLHTSTPQMVSAIVVEEGITALGNYAFADCSNAKGNTIRNKKQNIEVILPESLKVIGANAFDGTSITEITLPKNLEEIQWGAFSMSALTEVELPDSVTKLGTGVFFSCQNLRTVTFGKNLKKIGESAFAYSGLKDITITAGIQDIGPRAFEGCKRLSKVSWLSKKVKKLGEGVFKNCSSMKTIKLPYEVTAIGESAFEKCVSLESIKVGSKLKTVHQTAFKKCASLKKIQVPKKKYTAYKKLLKKPLSKLKNVKITKY